MKPLVSIITPCYNGESYVGRFLDSILHQTYPNIELFIINDGSKDNTEDIVLNYKPKFKEKGYQFNYIYQDNSGQSAAINKALPLFSGKYLTWPDSDDALPSDAIEKKVTFMENNPKLGLCICKTKVVEFGSFREIGEQKRVPPPIGVSDNLFYDLIAGNNVYYSPGGYFVRSSMFKDVLPSMQIQAPKEIGQNFQLLLPIAYKYPCGYIDEYLYFYSKRSNSHSHNKLTFEDKMRIIKNVSYPVLKNIIQNIEPDVDKRNSLERFLLIRRLRREISTMYIYKRNDNFEQVYKQLLLLGGVDQQTKWYAKSIRHPFYRYIWKIARKTKLLVGL